MGAILSGKVFQLSLAIDCEIQAPNESLPGNQGPLFLKIYLFEGRLTEEDAVLTHSLRMLGIIIDLILLSLIFLADQTLR